MPEKHTITPKANNRKRDLTGLLFGRLTVIGEAPRRGECRCWYVKCTCGKTKSVRQRDLISKRTVSCGCYGTERRRANCLKHGLSHRQEFWSYVSMKARCHDKTHRHYRHYGGRGITVCARWLESVANFCADMGEMPTLKHTVDRINNDLGYFCGKSECSECGPLNREPNCRWATQSEQHLNMRSNRYIEFNGKRQTISQWAKETGMGWKTISYRIEAGWTPEQTLTIPAERYTWNSRRARNQS